MMYQRCPSIALDGLNPCIFGMKFMCTDVWTHRAVYKVMLQMVTEKTK